MITYVIIGITVIVSYICFGNHELFRKLAFIPYRTVHNKEWYRLVTHGFVHADMTHLLVNMFTFWSFGTYMERAFGYLGFGTGGYLGLYFGGMVAASLYDLRELYRLSCSLPSSWTRGERFCFLPYCRFRGLSLA